MTKLYYKDPYIQSFTANVIRQNESELGTYVVLSETAFYPTGGGQPHDLGTLNDIHVLNVEEVDEEIRHYLEKPLEEIDIVHGVIDWDRRFDHMQQHTGQHILSAAFSELFNIETIGFHLGSENLTIDLNTDDLTEQMVLEAEGLANKIILENRPIVTKFITANEVNQYPLRKKPTVTDNIRLVIIPDFDYNGCGGTHPSSTGQAGSIKILQWERQKKKTRLQFACGKRVIEKLHQKQQVLAKLTQQLNAPEQEMEVAVERLLEKNKELEKALEEAHDALLHHEAEELYQQIELWNSNKVISKVFINRNIQQLQKLARMVLNKADDVNVFLVSENEKQLQFVCSRGPRGTINMKVLLSKVLPFVNGKGGGSELQGQGGGQTDIKGEPFIMHIKENL